MYLLTFTLLSQRGYQNNKYSRGRQVTITLFSVVPTRFSASLPCSQVDDRGAEGPSLSDPTTTVSDHAASMANQLDELLKGNVLHCPEVGVLLDALLSHHPHHLLTSCL